MGRLNDTRRRKALLVIRSAGNGGVGWGEFADALYELYGSRRSAQTTRCQLFKDGLLEEVRVVRLTQKAIEMLESGL